MLRSISQCCSAIAITCLIASVSHADTRFDDDVFINGTGDGFGDRLCVGDNCVDGEAYPDNTIKIRIKDDDTGLEFQDINNGADTWVIETNRAAENNFRIRNRTKSVSPFEIQDFASTNSLVIGDFGQIGIGTALPTDTMHLVTLFGTRLRMETLGQGIFQPQSYTISANDLGFSLKDDTRNRTPFIIRPGAPNSSLSVRPSGDIGLGTSGPDGKLHTSGDGVQLIYFESVDGGPVQVRFRTDSENRRFLAVDNDNNVKSQLIFLDDRINFTGPTDSGANLWLSVGPNGIVSQGPTCSSPCDLTFDPDVFTVPSIETRAAQMWQDMHLPAIGPTSPDVPMNLTEKMGGVIHELELAHIYIEQLHARLERQDEVNAQLNARLKALEAE